MEGRMRTSRFDGTGGVRTSPWKRESKGKDVVVFRGPVPVGTSGSRMPVSPDPLGSDTTRESAGGFVVEDNRQVAPIHPTIPEGQRLGPCRLCAKMVTHQCQHNEDRPRGNSTVSSSRKAGYTQIVYAHPTDVSRRITVRTWTKVDPILGTLRATKAGKPKARRVVHEEIVEY